MGQGFSLVGEGYINGGVAGVLTLYAGLGLATRFLYISRFRSFVWFVFWLHYVPTLLYMQRMDLGNFVSVLLKPIGAPLALIVFSAWILSGAKGRRPIGAVSTKLSTTGREGGPHRLDS